MESLRTKLSPILFLGISSRIWLCSSCASISRALIPTRSDRERNICNKKHYGQYKNHSNVSCSRQFSTTVSKNSIIDTEFSKDEEREENFVPVELVTRDEKKLTTFEDVGGLHEAKVEVIDFAYYLRDPKHFAEITKIGAKIPKGALLYGPPGCGKTLLAKALASYVTFFSMTGSEFVEECGGVGAAKIRNLFKEARKHSPCIVYIDKIDVIGRERSGESDNAEAHHTLNQLLVEMDGIGTTRDQGVIILASTNCSKILDEALLRAGRMDRHILVDYPTLFERREIFDIYLKQMKLAKLPAEYSEKLAQLSPGMSGADIANICNEAVLHAVRMKNLSVEASDFEYAVERVTTGVAKKSRLLSSQEKKIVAYHEAGHALVGWLLKLTDSLKKVSIVLRTDQTLHYSQYMSQDALFEQMCLMLGGRVAETLTFNNSTTEAHEDLQKVTRMAYDQIRFMGMNDKIGLVSFLTCDSNFGGKPFSKQTARMIDDEAKLLINKVYKFTEKLLQDNKEKLRIVAEALLEKESLSYKEIEQLVRRSSNSWREMISPNGKTTTNSMASSPTSQTNGLIGVSNSIIDV